MLEQQNHVITESAYPESIERHDWAVRYCPRLGSQRRRGAFSERVATIRRVSGRDKYLCHLGTALEQAFHRGLAGMPLRRYWDRAPTEVPSPSHTHTHARTLRLVLMSVWEVPNQNPVGVRAPRFPEALAILTDYSTNFLQRLHTTGSMAVKHDEIHHRNARQNSRTHTVGHARAFGQLFLIT